MPRIVTPSAVARKIDHIFPYANEEVPTDKQRVALQYGLIAGVLALFDRVPDELLATAGDEYDAMIFAAAEIHSELSETLNKHSTVPMMAFYPSEIHGDRNSLSRLRRGLSKCSDQAPVPTTHGLDFIADRSTRDRLRMELSAVETAYRNGEWKAATVLGGSVWETLLLWVVGSKRDPAKLFPGEPSKEPNPENWPARTLIAVAGGSKLISDESKQYAELARDARNLIHPAVVLKGGYDCDQGTASGAITAIYSIIRDLTH